MHKVIPPVKPYFPREDIDAIKGDVEKILNSGMLTLHAYTKEFEMLFAKLCKVRYAKAVNSGTSALEIALRAMGLKHEHEVLLPTNTFTSTAAAVFFAGGKPIFTDINPENLCIDCENVQRFVTARTKGVIVVHIGGLICPEIMKIKEMCEDRKLFLIEDAAHAHGSSFDVKLAGSLGDAGCFSFYPTKVMTTGEGGMITTNSEVVAQRVGILRDQGKEGFSSNLIVELGYNWRLPEVSAAIGLTQLKRLPEVMEKRNRIAQHYNERLKRIREIRPLRTPPNIVNNYYKYIAILDVKIDRDKLKYRLRQKGVKCGGEVYWPPLHLQPAYQNLLHTKEGDFPIAERLCKQMICLPMYTQMTIEDVNYVCEKLEQTLTETE